MSPRAARIVIAVQAAIIVALVIALLLVDRGGTPPADTARGHAMGENATSGDRDRSRDAKTRPPTRPADPDSRAGVITPRPVVEEDAAFRPEDPVGIVLYGTIARADRKPVEQEVLVSLEETETGDRRSASNSGTFSSYSMTGLRPGVWILRCRSTGFREVEQPVELVAGDPRRRLDLVLEAATTLKVKIVTPDGRLLSEALQAEKVGRDVEVSVVATASQPTGDLPMTEARSHRDFGVGRLAGQPPKGYAALLELREGPPVYVSAVLRHVVLETKLVPAGAEDVVFTISVDAVRSRLCGVKLRVVDADTGAAIANASVEISDRQTGGGGSATDNSGLFVQESLRPGLFLLTIDAPDHERVDHYVRLEPGTIADLGTYRLNRGVTIEGVVVDEAGKPVQASLSYRNLDRMDFPQPLDVGMGYGTESDGAFKIARAGRGRGMVTARATSPNRLVQPQESSAVQVNTASGSITGLRIVLKPGTPVVLEPKMTRSERYLLTVTDDAGTAWFSRSIWGPWPHRFQLPPGSYTVRVFDDKGPRSSTPLTVASAPVRMTVVP